MRAVVARPWLALAALLTSACALTGYDFGDYRGATESSEQSAAAGAGGDSETGAAGVGGACEPRGCFEQGLVCGPADDGCGQPLDCGGCFWWFQECHQNRCEIPE